MVRKLIDDDFKLTASEILFILIYDTLHFTDIICIIHNFNTTVLAVLYVNKEKCFFFKNHICLNIYS